MAIQTGGIYSPPPAAFSLHFAGIFVSNQDIYAPQSLHCTDIISRLQRDWNDNTLVFLSRALTCHPEF